MSTDPADISNDVVNQHVEVDAVETPIGVIQQPHIADCEGIGGGSKLGGPDHTKVTWHPVQG